MNVPFLDLKWQHRQIQDALAKRFSDIFENTSFILGPDVKRFEENFAKYIGATHCVGVSGGTTALALAFEAAQLPPGSEVITLPTSFFASASSIVHAGLVPRFADVDLTTGNFNYEKLGEAITPATRAILPVHLFGRPADMDTVAEFARTHNLIVIEDAAQAHGATYRGKKVGTFGVAGCFSFYPGKNLGAYGDGGAVVTDDQGIADRLRRLRNHGCLAKYDHELLGYNAKLDSLQAAVLDEKLKYLDEWNALRRSIASRYDAALSHREGLALVSTDTEDTVSSRHLYIIRLLGSAREAFMAAMKERGVATGIHYPDPLHVLPAFKEYGYGHGDLPDAELFSTQIVSLPIFPGMTDEMVEHVITSVQETIATL
jgi:dTDP-4-amino-4,6-dideoxygalactose transaminase